MDLDRAVDLICGRSEGQLTVDAPPVDSSRRRVLTVCSAALAAVLVPAALASAQSPTPVVPPNPRRRHEPGEDDSETPPGMPSASKAALEQRQKDIKKDVEKLFELAQDLKTEVDKTDSTAVLSMAMVKKTETIEKLARQIRDHAKG
jgi:hypothetical protein